MILNSNNPTQKLLNPFVLVAALGYFVDIYDLILFGIVKNQSLADIGIMDSTAQFYKGNVLLSIQMAGMLVGGVVFGVLGDKRGRLSTLFITITLYSLANIANGFVQTFGQYAVLRFVAGFGLSGELGVGITLVSEVMDRERRGLGAAIVSGIGIVGAVLAFVVAEAFSWRVSYWTGGVMGLLLLFLRLMVYEPEMYAKTKTSRLTKGNFFYFFTRLSAFNRLSLTILLAIPTWYAVSVLAINAPSMASGALGIMGEVKGSVSVMLHYTGAALGSFLFGWLSKLLQSRRKAILFSIVSMIVLTSVYFAMFGAPVWGFYSILFLLGIPMGGLWAVFMALISEQFGTNLRATATTSAPNFVRGSTILITWMLGVLTPMHGLWLAGVGTGLIVFAIALLAAFFVNETYGRDLDYEE